jgi:hypothetical protein
MPIGDTLLEHRLKQARLLNDLDSWFKFFDTATKKEIIRVVQERLRTRGTDADGDVIGYYSLATEFLSGGRKKQGDPFTLFDTGKFYASMFMVVFTDAFMVEGDGKKKGGDLFEKYGQNIISLTDEELQVVKKRLKTHYIKNARRTLQID